MNNQELNEYKKKLSQLSESEKKLRDLYLKKLSNGELQGPATGYSSIDKPWLKYFSDEQINEDAPKLTIYQNMVQYNKNHPNDIAIEYLGNKITYCTLISKINETANAFIAAGVKPNDIVTICSITTPEIIYSFYALNKIGAVSNFVDLRYTPAALEMYLKEAKSKIVVTLDLALSKINNVKSNTNIEQVITVNPVNSANRFIKFLAKLSSLFKKKNSEKSSANDWNNFVNSNNSNSEIDEFPYKPDYNAVIVHTGGTTGIPKGVVLSNDNFNNATLQIKNSNVKSGRNYRFLNIMPPFIAYGIVLGINAPITLGWHTIVIPKFDPNNFFDLLKKYKPNGIMGVPTYFENLMKDKKAQKADFSYIKNVLLGGDFTHEEFKKRLINFWRQHNSNGEVNVGYSLTEASACATFSSSKADAENSVGIPLTKTTIGVFEKDTTFEVPVNNNGEICIKTPTHMLGYYERSEETNKVLIKHDDGYYIHTGDSGYINGDGIVFVNGRYKRIIPRSGFKVFPSQIENVISEHPGVESCAVIGIPDSIDITVPKAIIVLKPSYIGQEEKVIDELNNRILKSILPPYFLPAEYEFVKELPLTNIGKVDFIKLQDDEKQNHLSLVKK